MKKAFQASTLRVVLLPLLGAAGAIVAVVYPVGHKAFCSGVSGVLL